VNGSGNVGIGTTNPSYKLDVTGSIRINSGNDRYLRLEGSTSNWTLITFKDGDHFFGWYNSNSSFYMTHKLLVGSTVESSGFIKTGSANTKVLLGAGGDKNLSDFVGSVTYNSSSKKLQYTPIGGSATDIVTFGSMAFDSGSYLSKSGDTGNGQYDFRKDISSTPGYGSGTDCPVDI